MEIHSINICNFVFWISFSLLKAKVSFPIFWSAEHNSKYQKAKQESGLKNKIYNM